ncbi:FR47-like protein [Pseudobutyrivibrio sp. ACV-2]|uniref:GNAT family N-acetyltransferase n=1 Tax=Pseudobutyrivibrio sp. ACV-2 TaxID=1520801 RepID=UPI000898F491|nr:GNAT family N-acetyltransferase [Pseudobutyrivibrio sp. ACV-2]SEA72526.1 FR47-like protein [Pseudobutyrivibrio sp. ACV-2]
MNKVDRNRYKEYIKCANECPANRVYPLSIATGTQDGDIYVDGKGCVLFWHYCGFAYISGDVSTDVLEEVYRSFLVSDTERRFLLITDLKSVSDYYSGRDLLRVDKRIEYTHGGIIEKQPELDAGFVIERITAVNIGVIQGRITPSFSWKDRDVFLRNGFGFMARSKEDGSFAAVAFSSAVGPEEVDIGVETAETHRHHGLASYLAYKMCEEIMRQGRRPVWAHAETNTGSQKTALSVGFKPIGINTVIQKK